ncbi:hypothetical protein B1748_12050 [Paenibacillus sp. MY03]|uniref:copper amine oxidase N-terminal domain-containing protein n=1 Tax=Paenibacillus sp. MY03 TaxID=302980 RepID=UPI000B3C4811|nr:copper amine oxidase N-terminal domain-containing protein [Paenibacillus sp. MY03]OUS76411.1 hypothetical protein B1748_12050 [Paenibacillus sp. MY03]
MRKWITSITLLFLIGTLFSGALFPGKARAADTIAWSAKQSAVYDQIHPYTLNWSGNPLDRGGLNLLKMAYTTKSAETDMVINQYGDIGAAAILDLDGEGLTDPTDASLGGFANSLKIKKGAVYLIVLHDGSLAKIQIDRVLPDNGSSITKVMFSYVLEQPEEESPTSPGSGGLEIGSPAQDAKNPAATYEFVGDGSITVPWAKQTGHVSWDIYRSDNQAAYVKMTDFKLTKPEFTDHYTFVGHTYLYKVVAYDKSGNIALISEAIKVVIAEEEAASGNQIVLQINNPAAWINGDEYKLEVAPFIHNGRTLIPLRFVSEALGAKLDWDGAARRITLTRGEDVIVLVIDSSEATVNGKRVTMDVPATIYKGKTMVPIRFVSEQFNQKITFDDATRKIYIAGHSGETSDASDDEDTDSDKEPLPSLSGDYEYFIGSWNMWVPAGQQSASGGVLQIEKDGTFSYYWNGPKTGTWTFDDTTGKLQLANYKSGWDWTATRTKEGITVSTFGVYETGTRSR